MRRILAALFAMTLLVAAAAAAGKAASNQDDRRIATGEAIYQKGIAGDGSPLSAARADGGSLSGQAAACIECHRRSGLGVNEGRLTIPPIAGRYLFHRQGDGDDPPYVPGMRGARKPYTDASLAVAIRQGIDADGKPLSFAMPRFALGDGDMAALIAYLRRLDRREVPGFDGRTLHFATIVAPDADPVVRDGVLRVIEEYFGEKNGALRPESPRLMSSGRTNFSKSMFRVRPHWELHVWRLEGEPETWDRQLDLFFARQPVFAAISGIAGRRWDPVDAFCNRVHLPCLFANVEAPPAWSGESPYNIYLNRGVLLEADLVADALAEARAGSVRQIFRRGDVGEDAAAELAAALRAQGIRVADAPLDADGKAQFGDEAATMVWLRAADLEKLPEPPAGLIEVSATMSGVDRIPLPAAWRDRVRIVYPVDLPDRRRVRIDYSLGWFRLRKIPVVAQKAQVDTYLACGLLSETLNHMVDAFNPDYLVERVEDSIDHRILTGYYPHLSLGVGQRYASKGGYIVRLGGPADSKLVVDRDWSIPH